MAASLSAAPRRLPRAFLLAWAAALLLALALRVVLPPDTDGVWLLTAAGRLLGGAVPYRDIAEPNPPASLLLYCPAAWLAAHTGLPATAVSDALVALGCAAAVGTASWTLRRAGLLEGRALPTASSSAWGLAALAILLVLPLGTFGQREHIATAALLPGLATLAVRRAGHRPDWIAVLVAGTAAGVACSIKPVFALAFAAPVAALLLERGWRGALAAELGIGAALTGLYALGVLVLCPDYAERMLPLMTLVYLPARLPWPALLFSPMAGVWLLLGASVAVLRARAGLLGTTLALASTGLVGCIAVQGKGFPYHGLPAVLTMAMALAAALIRWRAEGARPRVGWLAALAPGVAALLFAVPPLAEREPVEGFAPGLVSAMRNEGPGRRMVFLGETAELGPAFADAVGAAWVASEPFAWVSLYATLIRPHPERDPRLAAAIAAERDRFAADIARERPDTVLVEDEGWLAWARRGPALAAALQNYVAAGRYGPVILLHRKEPAP